MRCRLTLVFLFAVCCSAGAEETSSNRTWQLLVGADQNSFDDVASLQQDSATTIKDEYATNDVTPVLSFQCRPGDAEIIAQIDWGRFISSFNTEVGFKVDDGQRTWTKWHADRTEKMTTSPDANDTEMLIKQLASGATLEVEISPYSEGPVTATFALPGFATALDKLRDTCQ